MGRTIRIDPKDPDPGTIKEAVRTLRSGGALVYPTDTFYGLGANAADAKAVARLFAIKGRRERLAMPVLIGGMEQINNLMPHLPDRTRRLMDRFWPGALTLVLPAQAGWEHLGALEGRVGIRLPDHPVPRALAVLMGNPIVGTSANLSGAPVPRDPEGILAQIGARVDLLLDAGPLAPSRGSTVLDLSGPRARMIREGDIPARELVRWLPELALASEEKTDDA